MHKDVSVRTLADYAFLDVYNRAHEALGHVPLSPLQMCSQLLIDFAVIGAERHLHLSTESFTGGR